jgi:2-phosphoglycerate kinase
VAKTLVEDTEDHTRVPFLRGILIHSLQDAGMEFDSASQIASEVRSELDDNDLISNDELHRKVLGHLQQLDDQDIAQRYENRYSPLRVQVEQQCGRLNPFSRYQFRNSLETIGLKPTDSEAVVQMLMEHLTNKSIEVIKSRHLARLIYRYLRQSSALGPSVAHRWMVWHDFVNSGRKLIFLIGGTAGCGKSSTANTLANRLDIVHSQSTDMLREIMRTMIPEGMMPILHRSSFNAWKAFPQPAAKRRKIPKSLNIQRRKVSESLLIQGYRSQADLLTLAIEAVLSRATREQVSLVLEGVHLHPALMEKLQAETDAVVIPVMVGLVKRKQLEQRIKARSTNVPSREPDHYLEYFDEIWSLQSYLLSEADRTNINIVVNENRDKTFSDIMTHTISILAKDFDSTPEEVFGEKAFVDLP